MQRIEVRFDQTVPSLPYRLINQSVFLYSTHMSFDLLLIFSQRPLSLDCLNNGEGRLSHCVDSYERIGAHRGHMDILKRG